MDFPVLKGASYALIQANDMVLYQGSTQTSERHINGNSAYLQQLPQHFRSFDSMVSYAPNQVYIGNLRPKALAEVPRPWYDNLLKNAKRQGKYGEIMPLDEFYGLMKAVDAFDLVFLTNAFQQQMAEKLLTHPVVGCWKVLEKLKQPGSDMVKIREMAEKHQAEPMYLEQQLVGCVKRAHEFDPNMAEHVIFENLASKASGAFALQLLLRRTALRPEDVDYIIECSEEACGDMNQRGGGSLGKSIGEICGCINATGSDTRSFCAGPLHALVEAVALEQFTLVMTLIDFLQN